MSRSAAVTQCHEPCAAGVSCSRPGGCNFADGRALTQRWALRFAALRIRTWLDVEKLVPGVHSHRPTSNFICVSGGCRTIMLPDRTSGGRCRNAVFMRVSDLVLHACCVQLASIEA